jgi:uncharacterized protein (DUF58 family)
VVFDESFVRRLEALRLAARRRVATAREGDRLTSRPGGGAVFLSTRPYAQGDDFRQIDWPLYARLGQLFVRERAKEQALKLHLVIDASGSMRGAKLDFARRVGAAIALVAAGEGGEVALWTDGPRTLAGDALLHAVETLPETRPADAIRRMRAAPRPFAVVVSDFWDDLRGELSALVGAGGQVSCVRVLGREEIEPRARGMVRVVDAETGETADRYVGEEEVVEYRRLLDEDERVWREWAHRHEMSFARYAADQPWDHAVLAHLRAEGVVE